MTTDPETNPGEARNRVRQRRQWLYLGAGGLAGLLIGFFTGFFEQGDGSLFGGDLDDLSLPPAIAIAIAIGFLGAFLVLPLWGFRMIDDYKREQNLIGLAGGCLSVIAAYPVWAVLHVGGFVSEPTPFGLFAICYVSLIVSFVYAKWRS